MISKALKMMNSKKKRMAKKTTKNISISCKKMRSGILSTQPFMFVTQNSRLSAITHKLKEKIEPNRGKKMAVSAKI